MWQPADAPRKRPGRCAWSSTRCGAAAPGELELGTSSKPGEYRLSYARAKRVAADSHKGSRTSAHVAAHIPSDGVARIHSGGDSAGPPCRCPHGHSGDPTRSVSGSAPTLVPMEVPAGPALADPADTSMSGPLICPTVVPTGMSADTPAGCSMLILLGTRAGVPAAVLMVVSAVESTEMSAAGSVLVPVAVPVVASAESPAAGSVRLSADVTDGSHVGIPTCRSIGTEVKIVNFAT